MAFRINDTLTWIGRALGIDRASEVGDTPRVVTDTIQAVVTAQGWQSLKPEHIEVTVTNGTVALLPVVPENQQFLYLTFQMRHTQAATRNIVIAYVDNRGNASGIAGEFAMGVNQDETLSRPILVHQFDTLGMVSQQTITGDLVISAHFIRLAKGDYVPGNPYG